MRRDGFTLIEMSVVLAVVAILSAILVPQVIESIKKSRITKAVNETQVIAAAIMSLHKDTGKWPGTNENGPGGHVTRVLTGRTTDPVPAQAQVGARAGAVNWGTLGTTKQLSDFLYYNNPDDDRGPFNQNETGEDYPTSGEFAWRGPYLDNEHYVDPWGNQYVINSIFFPGNPGISDSHRVILLSAGADNLWSTSFDNAVTRLTIPSDDIYGPYERSGEVIHDDIGKVLATNN